MITPLEVFQLNSNNVGVWITTVDSLQKALNVVRSQGPGEYIVYSKKTVRSRFYEMTAEGMIVCSEIGRNRSPEGVVTDWRPVYGDVVSAMDAASLTRLIHKLEDVICARQQELAASPDGAESRELRFALRHVLSIKAERLGWPDPR